jgi:hypothetical protein
MPISTSDNKNRDRPGPGGRSSPAASVAPFVSATSAPGVPTPRIFPALPFAVAKVRESNQTMKPSYSARRWGKKWGKKPHRVQPIPADLDLAKTG